MANSNSFADVIGRQNNGQPIVIAATTTLHQAFQIAGSNAVVTVPNPMAAIDSKIFMSPVAAVNKPFVVRCGGYVIGGEPFQIDLVQSATGLTPVIASTGSYANGNTGDVWYLEAKMQWDPTSTFLRGQYSGFIGSTMVAGAALLGTNKPASLSALQFSCAVTVSSANANTQIALTEFSGDFI